MRIIGEYDRPECKISVFSWNGKFIIKLERDGLEQTFKVSQLDVAGNEDILKLLDGDFMAKAVSRFEEMEKSLHDAVSKL